MNRMKMYEGHDHSVSKSDPPPPAFLDAFASCFLLNRGLERMLGSLRQCKRSCGNFMSMVHILGVARTVGSFNMIFGLVYGPFALDFLQHARDDPFVSHVHSLIRVRCTF